MDRIGIRGLKCEMKIGVEAEERLYPQVCLLDLDLMLDLSPAGRSDAVSDTVDYAGLCDELRALAQAKEYRLVEGFAEAVAAAALLHSRVEEVRVLVRKTPLPMQGRLDSVGVEIRRKR